MRERAGGGREQRGELRHEGVQRAGDHEGGGRGHGEDEHAQHRRVERPARAAAGGGRHRGQRAVGAPPGRAVPDLPRGDRLPGVQRRAVGERRPVADGGPHVEHRRLADEGARADADPADLDPAVVRAVARDDALLPDEAAVADAEQVGAHRHLAAEVDDVAADLRPQRAEVERERGRPGEQHHRAGADQRLDHPEPQVGGAPHADRAGLPAPDERPLRGDRHHAERHEPDDPGEEGARGTPPRPRSPPSPPGSPT